MRRREIIHILSGAVLLPVFGASAQDSGRTYRIGSLHQSPHDAPHHVAFFNELRRAGFIEGQNLSVDWNGYGLRGDQLAKHAADLVKDPLDLVVCGGDAAIRVMQQVTATIPILAITDDMVGSGLVHSLVKPGGNTTGVSILATELDGKRQEILIEAVPGLRNMAALADANTTASRQLQSLQDAARARGVALSLHSVARPDEIALAINTAKTSGAAALNVLATPVLFNNRRIIFERAATLGIPAIYQWPEMAEEGGLMAYGPRIVQIYRELMGRLAVKILQGVKPADLPVEQPTKFELVINLKTSKAIGHEIPAGLVLRADKVIE